jgi:hypothetical protein
VRSRFAATPGREAVVQNVRSPVWRRVVASCAASLLMAACGGCKTPQYARYIYQDGEFGVIGIPQNSPLGSNNFQQQAAELMSRHFPEGYEIVRAEEVVEGQRVLDKSRRSEFETEPSIKALDQSIRLAKLAQTTSTQQKDSLPILESRIIYKRRALNNPAGPSGFALNADVVPKHYLDPNEMARCRERIELAELQQKCKVPVVAAKSGDAAAQQAVHQINDEHKSYNDGEKAK